MATKPDTNDTLTPVQLTAVEALATGASITAAADAAHVSRQTVSGWFHTDAEFRAAVNIRRGELWDEATARLRSMIPTALDQIEANLKNGSPAARSNAAYAVLKFVKVDLADTGSKTAYKVELFEQSRI